MMRRNMWDDSLLSSFVKIRAIRVSLRSVSALQRFLVLSQSSRKLEVRRWQPPLECP